MKYLAVLVNKKSVWHDGEAHTIEEWKKILVNKKISVKSLSPFHVTEDNYE